MSNFTATVIRINVEKHPNADAIELACVGDYFSIIQKGYLKTGDLAVYIQEGSIVPEYIQEEVGCLGKLAGPSKNRVKAVTLRGVLSQGLCYKAREGWSEGQDVAEIIGITKYEAPIPAQFSGEIGNIGYENTFNFDIENVKRHPNIIQDGELVSMTEKLHGTFTVIGSLYDNKPIEHIYQGKTFVSSKGNFAKGLVIRNVDANNRNTYIRTAIKFNLYEAVQKISERFKTNVYLAGETFGDVQDLHYGLKSGEFDFRAFNIFVGNKLSKEGIRALDDSEFEELLTEFNIKRVPVLYKGPFSKEVMLKYTDGKETYSGTESHMREGIIVEPLIQRKTPEIGRVVLKSVSAAYLNRKNGTEFN